MPKGDYAGKSVSTIAYRSNSTPVFTSSDNGKSVTSVYPNPTNQNIIVSFGIDKVNAIEIYNANGQSVFSKQLNKTAHTSESFDISRFQRGVYFVKVYSDKGAILKKIIKN